MLLLIGFVVVVPTYGQSKHNGMPLLQAKTNKVSFRVGGVKINGNWTIKPEANPNVLHVQVIDAKEKFTFYTDSDSVSYDVRPGQVHQFYVLLNKQSYVLTEVRGFKDAEHKEDTKLLNMKRPKGSILGELWDKHHVGDVVDGVNSYADKASSAFSWVKSKIGSGD
ncbi:hypothetical protein [Pontibacter harenae]|uniref:hypothetical protein n=1 Tax=Pontibacter harenae TaxID=2894083 RepID=UPI001E600280|nr:hypothetical protein [Pontibacter harenae]MCC9167835.1 hypothetical protein [Pontibacter harenae]